MHPGDASKSAPPAAAEPRVFLVGAGPGHPGLLTLRAVECLARADLVLYDQLVSPRLLDFAPPSARRVCVRELHEHHAGRVPLVNQVLIDAARQGQCVVRLKGGDPFVFGRGAEEGELLHQAGVPFEVVPGVTAALGAAFAGIPLTDRRCASAVAFVTGHEQDGRGASQLDWEALARFPGTLVFYMGVSRLAVLARSLIEHGKPADTPAALVYRATTGRQRSVEATLGELPSAVEASGLRSPSLVIVGPVVRLRPALNWFETRPLFGRRVLVTRPRHQAGEMVQRLESLGAEVTVLPAVEVREPADWVPVDRAIADLARFQWLVFTSANGVHFFLRRLRAVGRDLRALGGVRLAVIGPATAEALRSYHLEPDLMPAAFRSEELAEELYRRVAGQRVLLARADRGRELLRERLAEVAEVEQVAVYSQTDAVEIDAETADRVRRGDIDYVTLTSSNIARALVRLLDEAALARLRDGTVRLVSISPVTSGAVRDLGLPVASEATEYTTGGVIAALAADAAVQLCRRET
jgi:uroporphyrinogen III methyltransferase/synthase